MQVCNMILDQAEAANIRALLAGAASWSRRRAVALACYAFLWVA